MQLFFLIGFIVLFAIHLIGEYLIIKEVSLGNTIRYISKPLLMPFLLGYYVYSIVNPDLWVILAIIGGFIGDISLMIPDPNDTKKFFRIGLIAFLLGHIFYIIAILLLITTIPLWSYLLSLPFIVYGIIVYRSLIEHTGKMKIPVTIYIIVILLMGIATTLLWESMGIMSIIYLILGSIIFIISDTINAFNRFKQKIHYERIYTMATYLIGQFLLILGFVVD